MEQVKSLEKLSGAVNGLYSIMRSQPHTFESLRPLASMITSVIYEEKLRLMSESPTDRKLTKRLGKIDEIIEGKK